MKIFAYAGVCMLALGGLAWVWTKQAPLGFTQEGSIQPGIQDINDRFLKDLTSQSDLIVSGRAGDSSVKWIEDGRVLVTVVEIAVDDVLKGEAGTTILVALPGGIDANRPIPVAMTYPGAPSISPQEEVFLFLDADERTPGDFVITGFSEGKFSIAEGESGEKLITRTNIRETVSTGPGVVRGNREFFPESLFKNKVKEFAGR